MWVRALLARFLAASILFGVVLMAAGCLTSNSLVMLRVAPAALEEVRSMGMVRAEFSTESNQGWRVQISEKLVVDVGADSSRDALDKAVDLLAARSWTIDFQYRPTIVGMESARWKDTRLNVRPYHPAYLEGHPEVLERVDRAPHEEESLVYLEIFYGLI